MKTHFMKNIDQIAAFIQTGDIESLKKALSNNPDLANCKTENGISLLTFAVYCRNIEATELIKQNKSSFDIYEHIMLGNLVQTKDNFKTNKASINQFSADGFTPLGLACFFGHSKIVEFLIANGADVNIASNNDFKVSPLHSACAISNLEIAASLLKNGANVNVKQQGDATSLHSAAHNGQLKLVKLLVKYGADMHAKMKDGQTALSMAEDKSFSEVAEFLKLKEEK